MKSSLSLLSLIILAGSMSFWGISYCSASVEKASLSSADIVIPERREFPTSKQVSACEDFYEYSCRPVINSFELPSDRSRWTFSLHDSAERILRFKKQHLASSFDRSKVSKRTLQYMNYYQSCVSEEARKKSEVKAYQKLLATFVAMEKTNNPKQSLLKWLGDNIIQPHPRLINFFSHNNQSDSNAVDVLLWADLRRLPARDYYEKPEVLADYASVLSMALSDFKGSPQKRAKAIVEFEKEFAAVYPTRAEFREIFWVRKDKGISKDELLEKYPNLFLYSLLANVPEATFIRHLYPEVYAHLNSELGRMSFEEIRDFVLAGYLLSHAEYAAPEVFSAYRAFQVKHLGESPEMPSLQERCAKSTMEAFDPEIDHSLFDEYFPSFPENEFRVLAENVRQTMKEKLSSNSWLHPETKKLALKKLESIRMQVVRPKIEKNWGFLPLKTYDPDDYVENQGTNYLAEIEKTFSELGKLADKDVWGRGPLTVNASYMPPAATFIMYAGILQYPFYDVDGSYYANLGSVGSVIGHEVGHSFDDQGSKYDSSGNLNPWMKEADLEHFAKLSSQVDEQYIKACERALERIEELTVSDDAPLPTVKERREICRGKEGGKNYADLTRGENIGDIVGLSFAYETAFKNDQGSVEDKKAFFLQYGREMCGKIRRGYYMKQMRTDVHAQIPMRTNEPVRHFDGFHEAFNCKPGDPMYLPKEKRVNIW